jgi:cytochrome c-type biogenesis protein CcmH
MKPLRYWVAAVLLTAWSFGWAAEAQPLAENPVVEKRLNAISENLRCLVCQNESLAGSRADLAEDLRREVRNLIVAGKSDKEIIDFLVARYGDYVLYDPPFKSTTLFLWVGPFAVLVGGLAGLILFLRRRARQSPTMPELADNNAGAISDDAVKELPVDAAITAVPAGRGRWLLWVVLLLIPVGAVSVYLKVGTPAAMNPEALRPTPDPEVMVARLQAKMDANPDNPQGWMLLGRAYMVMNRPQEAIKAYDHILPEVKKEPQLTAAYAEALAASGNMAGAQAWIDGALKRGNKDPQLIFLAGGLAFAQGDNAKAIRYWNQVLKQLPPDSDEAKFVQENIAEAKARQK